MDKKMNFEELMKKWEDKIISFSEFDSVLNVLFSMDEDENNHPYIFEDLGIQDSGCTKWDCIENSFSNSIITTSECFSFYTRVD